MSGAKLIGSLCTAAALVGLVLLSPTAAIDVSQKAEFIVKLIDYVEWPAGKNADGSGATVIACVGDSPVAAKLKELAAAKASEGLKITVKSITTAEPMTGYQIVFIGSCDKAELAKVLKGVAGQPTLTVSNCAGFAKFGVMVNILDDSAGGAKVSFEVNTITVKDAGLKIGSQLLKLATVI